MRILCEFVHNGVVHDADFNKVPFFTHAEVCMAHNFGIDRVFCALVHEFLANDRIAWVQLTKVVCLFRTIGEADKMEIIWDVFKLMGLVVVLDRLPIEAIGICERRYIIVAEFFIRRVRSFYGNVYANDVVGGHSVGAYAMGWGLCLSFFGFEVNTKWNFTI